VSGGPRAAVAVYLNPWTSNHLGPGVNVLTAATTPKCKGEASPVVQRAGYGALAGGASIVVVSRGWPLALAIVMSACGSASVKDVAPRGLLDPSQPRTDPTVVLSTTGVDPVDSHLNHPVTVTFINRDTVRHELESAPEIGNGPCPEMAQVGAIEPGGTGTVTISQANYICSFHDALQPSNLKFKGIIVVH